MRFGLIMSEVGQGLRRNFSMVVSVVLVTFISLTFVGAAILLQMQINEMKGYWYDRAQVAVYLCTDTALAAHCNMTEATEEQKANVAAILDSPELAPLINAYEFENHEEAYEKYVDFADTSEGDYITPEMLPETYWVNMVDPSQSDVLIETLSGTPGVDEVADQRKYLDPIFDALNAASYTAIGIAALMLVAAVLLIATTIRLSAFSRRRELGIMRLVGASNRFIQTPFVLEGVIAAVIGAVLAGGATVAVVHFFVQGYLAELMASTSFVGLTEALIVVPVLLAVGILLAALSANVAISRYLKV
ncbi:permease-like cell division protein FtsX [Salinibacterium sp. SYSU T00001]|uniref:permease-like cell division protein FtsX n=1 Tax=Homoserinimonas sedimenticola TaxID=2986805 RepID=UPI0022360096|nr:permease-like cell division protein FtsX [Salinibacterium sedimenticola]MCW4386597.1 permease-like cell division protein FtsX [Salinibacterium sedimenticola]